MFEAKITLELDNREIQRAFDDFKKSFLDEDDFLGIGASLSQSFSLAKDDVNTYMTALTELDNKIILTDEEF
jgi:hypothetical protein